MINVSLAKLEQVWGFRARDVFESEPWRETLMSNLNKGRCWAMSHEAKVLAFFGWNLIWPGVAQVWAVTSDNMEGQGLKVTKAFRAKIAEGARVGGVHRVQMFVRSDYEEGIRWAHALGFHQEALLTAFGSDGEDYWIMVRFF